MTDFDESSYKKCPCSTTGKYSSQEVTELSAMGAPETMKMNRQVGG
jgi:hypothetical protein